MRVSPCGLVDSHYQTIAIVTLVLSGVLDSVRVAIMKDVVTITKYHRMNVQSDYRESSHKWLSI